MQMVRSLKGWLSDLKEKKVVLLEALEQAKEPTLPELLFRYLEQRSGERADWTSRGKLKGTVADYNKVQAAMDFLRKKGISTVESLDTRLDEISKTAVSVMGSMKKSEKRIKTINTMLSTKPPSQSMRSMPPSAGRRKKRSLRRATGRNWTLTMPLSGI